MSSPQLAPAMASASAASSRALRVLVGLAEALGTPGMVAAARTEAEEVAAEAEAALEGLEAALAAALAATAAKPVPAQGLEAKGLYQALEAVSTASAQELERELERNRRRRRLLRVLRDIALGLLLLCTPLLSLDVVREALGVTQESHLVPCLATVTLLCQVALWAMEKSEGHLATAADQQRHQAFRYRRLARSAATNIAAATEATEATKAASAVRETLEEVANHLQILVAAVTQDLELAQGFPASARALGNAVVALGTVMQDEEGTRRLARALEALPGDV